MKLITEVYDDVEVILEATESGKQKYNISGIFAQAEVGNRNGRLYPKSIMEREITKYNKDYVSTRRALGELSHPSSPTVNPDRASHLITELKFDGNDVYGKANILDTPCGNIVKAFIDEGVKFGVSTRGLGSLKKNNNGLNEVQEDFALSTIDIVTDPSAPSAFVQGIYEGKEWVCVNGMYEEQQIEEAKKIIKNTSYRQLNEMKLKLFNDFIRNISA